MMGLFKYRETLLPQIRFSICDCLQRSKCYFLAFLLTFYIYENFMTILKITSSSFICYGSMDISPFYYLLT